MPVTWINSGTRKCKFINDDLKCREYYNDLCEISHLQVLLSGQLFKLLLQSLHRTADKHPGIAKKLKETREKLCFHTILSYSRNCVRGCDVSMQNTHINGTRMTPETFDIPERKVGLEDFL